MSVYSIDAELFDNELSETTKQSTGNKNRSIWPLPGGIYSYVETLNLLLAKIESSNSTKDDLINWFVESFENVVSTKTAAGYLNVPKLMGLIDFQNSICILTETGREYYENQDIDFLFNVISSNILAFEEIYELLVSSEEPKQDTEILEFVNENFDVDWTTLAQVNFRLLWLINLGRVEKTSEGYVNKS